LVKVATKEIASREPEATLEERFRDHNLIGVGGWDILIFSQPPLEDGMRKKKVVID
jgi:hypothetical protein